MLPLLVPPLRRDRPEDIPLLADHFLERCRASGEGDPAGFTGETMDAFLRHSWPGNVRELENEVRLAAVLVEDGGEIRP